MDTTPTPTRMMVMGSQALTIGFSLIGAETYPDATPDTLEGVLADLVHKQEKALLFLEHDLARSQGPWLQRVREEGGRTVVVELPSLHAPGDYHPAVEDLVRAILGSQALEPRA